MIEYSKGFEFPKGIFTENVYDKVKYETKIMKTYLFNPEPKAEPDYYIWHDPWEHIDV